MNMVYLVQGHCHLGVARTDENGNVVEGRGAHFESAEDGPCIAVGTMDADTMEQTGDVSIFGDYDVAGYTQKAQQLLAPTRRRPSNMPDIETIVKSMTKNGVDVCDYCPGGATCFGCALSEYKAEANEEEGE